MKTFILSICVLMASQASFAAQEMTCQDQQNQNEILRVSYQNQTIKLTFLRGIRLNVARGNVSMFTARPNDQMYLNYDKTRDLYVREGNDALEITVKFDRNKTMRILGQVESSEPGYGFVSAPRYYNCR